MLKIFEILSTIKNESSDNLVLNLESLVDKNGLEELMITDIPKNSEYFLTGGYHLSIQVGKEFNVLFSKNDPVNYVKTDCRLKEIRLGRGVEVDILPEDTHGECLIEFNNKKPELLTKLNIWGRTYDKSKNDFLYLTTQPVMDRIIELLG